MKATYKKQAKVIYAKSHSWKFVPIVKSVFISIINTKVVYNLKFIIRYKLIHLLLDSNILHIKVLLVFKVKFLKQYRLRNLKNRVF